MKLLWASLIFPLVCLGQSLDQYGGRLNLPSPTGSTGVWKAEKYALTSPRWMITTPAGHGLFCDSQFQIVPPASLNITAKYGSTINWQNATLGRYTGWGFNCLGEYSDVNLIAAMNAGSLSKQIPYMTGIENHFVYDAINHRTMISGQTLSTDAVKDFQYTAAKITNFVSNTADSYDPNFSTYVGNYAAARVAPGNLAVDAYARELLNPWAISIAFEDADFTYGFGPGPDNCTTIDGSSHSHVGWMALSSVPNLYAQWAAPSSPYQGTTGVCSTTFCADSSFNWMFSDPEVKGKSNIVAYLQAKYGTIGALNTAWGSSYTAFATAKTRYTGETVAVTNGSPTYSHTLAHATGVTAGSFLFKVDGVPLGTDPPTLPGTIIGQWPDGVTAMGGTINYATGAIVLTSTSAGTFNKTGTNSTSLGTINLGNTNVVAGTIQIRLEGGTGTGTANPDCRITDDGGPGNSWQVYPATCPLSPYTVTGTINYSTGTISSLTITPAIPTTQHILIQFSYSVPLPGTHTVTVDYDVNGWCVGTTLADPLM